MDPLDLYTEVQPFVQKEIEDSMEKFTSERKFDVAQIPAHTHTGVEANHINFSDLTNRTRFVLYRILGSTTDTSVSTTVGGNLVMPFGGYITEVGATVDTAGTTGTTTVDFKKKDVNTGTNASIMLTKVTIDSTETTSRTAATSAVLNSASVTFKVGDIFTFNIDAINTTPAKGLTIFMNVVQTTP